MRKLAILLIALSMPIFASCGSGVSVQSDSPVDIPTKIEAGGVTIQAPEEVKVGDVTIKNENSTITVSAAGE